MADWMADQLIDKMFRECAEPVFIPHTN